MPDAPQAGDGDHGEVGAELRGDDAEREPRVLHPALNDDRAAIGYCQAGGAGCSVAEAKPERVVPDHDRQRARELDQEQLHCAATAPTMNTPSAKPAKRPSG